MDESCKWFVGNGKKGNRYVLGRLANDPGLPLLPGHSLAAEGDGECTLLR